jgi:hypothetical protein
MPDPILRISRGAMLTSALLAALLSSACSNEFKNSAPPQAVASPLAACGGTALAAASMHCPPGFVQPKS